MKTILFLLLTNILGYCSNNPKINEEIKINSESANFKNDTSFTFYKYEDKGYRQIVKVKKISEEKILFEIETENKILKIKSNLEGYAIRNINAIPENDEDEKGNSYYCFEYRFRKGDCKINIRIEKDTEEKLKIKQAYCDTLGMNNGLYSLKKMLVKVNFK